ncbi:MAG: CocE/NonD family hydrolase [Opitutae bacterium]|nr:CocE/NonD family hydrolase [Opitutae bacterium]
MKPASIYRLLVPLGALLMSTTEILQAKEILLEQGREILVERNVPMKTRDGVTLRADVFRPNQDGKFPVILERLPYDKRIETFGPRAAANGYVFIVQDVRGRYASEGEWYPLRHERDDGYETVEWAATLPYANGKVGLFGFSYSAATQLAAATAAPPHLACIMPGVMASNAHEQWVYVGGAFSQALNQGWTSSLAINTLERRVGRSAQPSYWDMKQPLSSYPLLVLGTVAGLADYYYDWLKHPDYDDYWKELSFAERFDKITVPALHFGGWYDYFQQGSIACYLNIKQHGGSEAARKGQRLVMMVGGHAGPGPKIGEVDFGAGSVVDLWKLALRWYDYTLKGIDNGMAKEKPVRLFVMGSNQWREADDWPLADARTVRYYFHSGGKANTAAGDGKLGIAAPEHENADRYTYDPTDPVPTVGGPAFGDATLKQGPYNQAEVEKRADVLVYSTEPLARDTEIIGAVKLELHASSSVVDTDFTGKLVDVAPDGTALNLTEGILRARYRSGREKAELLQPGEIYPLTVDLGSTAHVFKAGHCIRVEVSSSNFPRFDRNLNTGADIASRSTESLKADNVIYHDSEHPSALVLQLLP